MSVSTPSHFRPEVPASIWRRTGRPRWATSIRIYISVSLIWIGFFFDGGVARWGWVAAGVGVLLLFPTLIRLLLRPLEREVQSATRRTASHRLGLLRGRRLVRTFAPHGWRTAQEGTLHLIAGDGQAAAQAFAETGRLARLREPSAPLLSAQVHAWIIANDLAKAREFSTARDKLGELGPWDRLHRSALLLSAGQRDESVLGELKELRDTLGDHPWILAGLTLAHERSGELPEALTLSEAAKTAGAGDDELAAALLKRADKGLRAYKKVQNRQERKRLKAEDKPSAETKKSSTKGRSEDPRSPRGSKKARKQARREARHRAKAEERRRSEEGARRQRELAARARVAKQAPAEPVEAAPKSMSAAPVSTPAPSVQSAPEARATPTAQAPQASVAAKPEASRGGLAGPVIASPVAPQGTGVVLPPLVRPGQSAASTRQKPPPPPVRPRTSRTSAPTPRPPRLNLPRLVGTSSAGSAAGLPTRSPRPPADSTPRVLVPPPVATAPIEESGDWGDVDTLFQD